MNLLKSSITQAIILLTSLTCSAHAGDYKIYLLGERHDDPLAINIQPKLQEKCFKKEIFYLLEGIMREEIDESSLFSKGARISVEDADYCFGMEEPISYHISIATIAYCYTLVDEPTAHNYWHTMVMSRKRSSAINAIFKYLRKNGSDETKALLGCINDELLNLEFRHVSNTGYGNVHQLLCSEVVKSLGTNNQWLSFLGEFLEVLWTHAESISGADLVKEGFLEKLFSLKTVSEVNDFLNNYWINIALDVRNMYMANNIAYLYSDAKLLKKHLVASVGASHLSGVKRLLKTYQIPEEDIIIIDTSDKIQIADIVLDLLVNKTENQTDPVNNTEVPAAEVTP